MKVFLPLFVVKFSFFLFDFYVYMLMKFTLSDYTGFIENDEEMKK